MCLKYITRVRTKLGLAFENMSYIKSPIFPPEKYRQGQIYLVVYEYYVGSCQANSSYQPT